MKPIGGFILAGGESARMGSPKSLLELNGEPMIVRVVRIVEAVAGAATVVGSPQVYEPLGLRAITDDFPGAGPLGGIATALRAADQEWNLIVACDLPYLTPSWLEYLAGRALALAGDVVLPMSAGGAEPLCAMYQKRCEEKIRAALSRGTRKVTDGLANFRVETIEPAEWKAFDSEGLLFKNMNSPAEYEEARARFEGRARK
jgi:molybdenum cofactor guanylyltransferase